MNTEAIRARVVEIIRRCQNALSGYEGDIRENAEILNKNIERISRSFSGSCLGYHATIYYSGFSVPPPGDRFNSEWGFGGIDGPATSRNWVEYTYDQVRCVAFDGTSPTFHSTYVEVAERAARVVDESRHALLTVLDVLIEHKDVPALARIKAELDQVKGMVSANEVANSVLPSRVMSRDSAAIHGGIQIPPHIAIHSESMSLYSPYTGLNVLVQNGRNLLDYMEIHSMVSARSPHKGERVFVGHGNSPVWRELKDFLQDRLHLSWEEFNRISPAGEPTAARLQNMLDCSCFAFLVFTADDQHADQTVHARENVIHEAGLFQGRLGFMKAIVLLEEGCAEFSNIFGLGQIRFPRGNMAAAFEEVRRVLEREGIIYANQAL